MFAGERLRIEGVDRARGNRFAAPRFRTGGILDI
jgi:hypothetical protein